MTISTDAVIVPETTVADEGEGGTDGGGEFTSAGLLPTGEDDVLPTGEAAGGVADGGVEVIGEDGAGGSGAGAGGVLTVGEGGGESGSSLCLKCKTETSSF